MFGSGSLHLFWPAAGWSLSEDSYARLLSVSITECKLVQPPWESIWHFLRKLGIVLPLNSAITLLSIYPKMLHHPTRTLAQPCS
ncbi:mCG1042842 [Mus musculus]|nr:mCG1042842 [Mus musculus]